MPPSADPSTPDHHLPLSAEVSRATTEAAGLGCALDAVRQCVRELLPGLPTLTPATECSDAA
jgi:hypothetical protein